MQLERDRDIFWVSAAKDENLKKGQQLQRTKVYEWLCATEMQLVVMTGHGLRACQMAADEAARPPPSVLTIDKIDSRSRRRRLASCTLLAISLHQPVAHA